MRGAITALLLWGLCGCGGEDLIPPSQHPPTLEVVLQAAEALPAITGTVEASAIPTDGGDPPGQIVQEITDDLPTLRWLAPPGSYAVQADLLGTAARPDGVTGFGLLYRGETLLTQTSAGTTATLTLASLVPTPEITILPNLGYRVAWTAITNSSSVEIEDTEVGGTGLSTRWIVTGTDTTYLFPSDGAAGVERNLRLRALLGPDEVSAYSELVRVRLPGPIPPSRTVDLAVSGTSTTTITLTWTAPGDDEDIGTASAYDLRWSTDPISAATFPQAPGRWLGLPQPAGTLEEHSLEGLEAATAYYLALVTRDDAGHASELSNVVEVQTQPEAEQVPPDPVIDLVAGALGENEIRLDWTAPRDNVDPAVASYEVRWSTNPIILAGFPDLPAVTPVPLPAATERPESLRVTGLVRETTYFFALRSRDSAGNVSALSNVATATTPDLIAPRTITTLRARGGTSTLIPLTWTAPGDDGINGEASAYDLRFATSPIDAASFPAATRFPTAAPGPSETLEHLDVNGLTPATTYYFVMVATDEAGNRSLLSNLASGTTAP